IAILKTIKKPPNAEVFLYSIFNPLFMENSCFITLPVTVFFSGTFVMKLLTFHQSNFQLGMWTFPVTSQWYAGITFLVNCTHQLFNFTAIQQQFAGTGGFRHHVC